MLVPRIVEEEPEVIEGLEEFEGEMPEGAEAAAEDAGDASAESDGEG